ncbi:hypothetical protein SAMN05421776_1173 [Nocardia farcinica]|uniref:Uncharacterized protein n=1 Tax=Nocardia farcinica TaxID=37329 RepID=A0A0H5PB82_NOCFR|nr:hypothetical protein [Nocardia farcinica]AXK86578.1 hypothetical protein DXT66_13920 [Nocardia farcinica]PFW99011.1 hypothetical protein CJ469_05610 [Nocardia farcinica]PFX06049.1 hypothetical protein CJ468_04908 [Nocardia farcinica]CRY79861.1 Uncharacterised protein [Nocardia farcinica]SIT33565.1 hypothetical protein SAMN05421776_1173 [Nocardia farcinica]
MPRKGADRYKADWSDESYPEIVRADEDDEYATTFQEAKHEVIDHFTQVRDHARDRIASMRGLRKSDVV